MASNTVYYLFILFCFTLFHSGTAITCYNCFSSNLNTSYNCGDSLWVPLEDDPVETVTCPDGVPCIKYRPAVIGGGTEEIIRGCYENQECDGDLNFCYICNEDLCNTSNLITPFSITILLMFTVVYISRLYNF